MAIKFDEFSHYSHPSHFSGDLPAYDISGGEEVYDYWRSPYDPTLTYFYNVADENDYWQYGYAGYGRSISYNVTGSGAGIKYPRFIHDGYWHNLYVTRESGYPNIAGGDNISGSPFGYLPAVSATLGSSTFNIIDWQFVENSGAAPGAYANEAFRYPVRKVLKHGRLYLMYCGGHFDYDPTSFSKGIEQSTGSLKYNAFASNAGDLATTPFPYMDEPELHIYDARYLPGSSLGILRVSEASIFNPSPVIGINDKGGHTQSGIATYHGLGAMSPSFSPLTGGLYLRNWGMYINYNAVGHVNTWGKVFAVGEGQMMFSTALRAAEMWSVNGEKNAISSKAQGYALMHLYPWGGGYTNRYSNSGYSSNEAEDGRYYDYEVYRSDVSEIAAQPPLFLKNGRISFFSRYNDQYASDMDRDGDNNILVHNSHDFRVRIRLGDPSISGTYSGQDTSQEVFAVGNGRLYAMKFLDRTYYSGAGYLNSNEGALPYWNVVPSFLRPNYSAEIFDLNGVIRKCSFAAGGGSLLNNTSRATTGNSDDRSPVKMGAMNRIVAGCGRVVFANTEHWQYNDAFFNTTNTYGKAYLYTQDGAFIKTLSPKDDHWSYFGTALNTDIKFGFKMEIANNLIFILSPYFDLSSWVTTNSGYQTWGGRGRMYIYSLDGELLAAFSAFNLGYSQSFPFNFTDFVTDGVNLFIFNNQVEEYNFADNNVGYKTPGLIPMNSLNQYYSSSDRTNNGGGVVYKRNHRPMITHLKLPETLDNYYDNIVEMYRY